MPSNYKINPDRTKPRNDLPGVPPGAQLPFAVRTFILMLFLSTVPAVFYGKQLPAVRTAANIDTSLLVYLTDGTALRYHHYFPLLWKGEHYLDIVKGRWYLRKYPDSVLTYLRSYGNRLDSASRLNNIITRLSRADKVVVLKGARKLIIQRGGKALFTFPVNLGKNPVGDKTRSGDGRTPEGMYTLDKKMWTGKYYHNFHISYPDSTDLLAAKKAKTDVGGDVMIHGTSTQRAKLKDWTNGCIALLNSDMDILFAYVPIGTLIEIRK